MPTPPPLFPNPYMDGTYGVLLAWNDAYTWADSLVLAFLFCEPPNIFMPTGCLPEEQQNPLSTILLPV